MYSIYLIVNTINGKAYIGQTKQLVRRRWKAHQYYAKKGSPVYFASAIRKHGADAFAVSTIGSAETKQKADELERMWILLLGTHDERSGYNTTLGGEGGVPTESVRRKIGKACKALWRDPEFRQRSLASRIPLRGEKNGMYGKAAWLGKNHSEATKKKLSRTRKRLFRDPAFKERMTEANRGKHHTAEGRANISKALKSNQYRRGIPHSEEVKARIRESMKRAYAEGRRKNVKASSEIKAAGLVA